MGDFDIEEELVHIIDRKREELLKLCCNLVKARSENPPGDVSEAASVAEEYLRNEGLKVEVYEPEKGRLNLLATVGEGKRTLILNGHIDVVPTGDAAEWSFPPLLGEIREGRILGRGTSDMKSGVASIVGAVSALSKFEDEMPGRVLVTLVCDEETGGVKGTRWLADEDLLKGDACLIAECTGREKTGYAIEAGERGILWIHLKARGKPAHGSTPMLGKNAILMMMEALSRLRGIDELKVVMPSEAEELVIAGCKFFAKGVGDCRNGVVGLERLLDHYSMNVGTIRGGTKTNVVPESCEADLDIRIPLGGSRDQVERYLASCLPEDFEYEVKNFAPPSYTPSKSELVEIVKGVAETFLGYPPPAIIIPACSDAHIIREKLGIPVLSFGPGYSDLAHVRDEYVKAEDVVNFAKIYAVIAARWMQRLCK
ncbi:MAG: ArgE/DapE family deacylase [Candidatus Bathyarchaeia archaeon]